MAWGNSFAGHGRKISGGGSFFSPLFVFDSTLSEPLMRLMM